MHPHSWNPHTISLLQPTTRGNQLLSIRKLGIPSGQSNIVEAKHQGVRTRLTNITQCNKHNGFMGVIFQYCKEMALDTNMWRWRGVGVALVFSAAVDKEALEGGEALLPVVLLHETAPLLVFLHPGVETDVSSAGSICASAFVILTCTQQFSFIFSVRSTTKDTNPILKWEYLGNVK